MTLRAEMMVGVAARAAQRVADKQARIAALYGGEDSPLTLRLEDLHEEMAEAGHVYDENCQRPSCVKLRQMVAGGIQQVLAELQQAQNGEPANAGV